MNRLITFSGGLAVAALVVLNATPAHADMHGTIADGLQLYYDFDNDTVDPGGINDLSKPFYWETPYNGSGVDDDASGTIDYTFSTDTPMIGGGLSLDLSATTDYVVSDTPGYTGVSGTAARSIAAWVKITDDTVANPHIVEWGNNASGERYTFKVNTSAGNGTLGGLRVEVQGGFIITGSLAINDGAWHHVAATWEDDGTPDVEDVLLYVDGVLDNVTPPPTTPNAEPINTGDVYQVTIGGSSAFADRSVAGLIDEVGIWDRALSAEEVTILATQVPEPSTFALIGLGAGLIFGLRRRNG